MGPSQGLGPGVGPLLVIQAQVQVHHGPNPSPTPASSLTRQVQLHTCDAHASYIVSSHGATLYMILTQIAL